MTTLSHRERVLRSLRGKDIDRVPLVFTAEDELCEKLAQALGAQDLDSYFEADTIHPRLVFHNCDLPDLSKIRDADDVDTAEWFNRESLDLDATIRVLKKARATGRAVCSGVWASLFTNSRRAMGEERYLIEMHSNPKLISRIIERLADAYLDINDRFFSTCIKYVDIFYFGSDFGTQLSMFISPDHYRQFFKPQMKRLVEQAKSYSLEVMYHTCGAVTPIIPDLIEIGVDILDPIQVSAANMDPVNLAAHFKGKIAFHGGISTQKTLPFATPDVVRKEVTRTIDALGPLGYIAGPDQKMIGDVAVENVVAMYRAIKEYKF